MLPVFICALYLNSECLFGILPVSVAPKPGLLSWKRIKNQLVKQWSHPGNLISVVAFAATCL